MLTEREIREKTARGMRIVAPAMIAAVGGVFLYFIGLISFREPLVALAVGRFGEAARDVIPIALILPAFAIFLLPSCLAAGYAARYRTRCPSCGEDISAGVNRLLQTRRCPECGVRIVEGGRAHSDAAYGRYIDRRSRSFLARWLWAWPALGALAIAWGRLDPSALDQCPQCRWVAPLVGIVAAGWSWLRTSDRRYLPPLLASTAILGLAAALYWRWP